MKPPAGAECEREPDRPAAESRDREVVRIFAITVPAFFAREKPISRKREARLHEEHETAATITHSELIPTVFESPRRWRAAGLPRRRTRPRVGPATLPARQTAPGELRFISVYLRPRIRPGPNTGKRRAPLGGRGSPESGPTTKNRTPAIAYPAVESSARPPVPGVDSACNQAWTRSGGRRRRSRARRPPCPSRARSGRRRARSRAAARGAEVVEELVGVQRVVVEEHQPLGADPAREGERVGDAPSGPSRRGRGTPRRCTGSRGSAGRRRGRGRSPRSTPARARRAARPAPARGRGCRRAWCRRR